MSSSELCSNTMVSVIIPAYNVESSLEHCVRSVLNQSYRNFEIILIDDGSKDNTAPICDRLAQQYTNVSVVHQCNSGVSVARNKGIDISKGKYLCFIDSDDYVEPDYLLHLLGGMRDANADISFCNLCGKLMLVRKPIMESPSEIVDAVLGYGKAEDNQGACNKMFDRDVVGDLRFDADIFMGEDTLFCIDYAKRCKKGVYVHQELYHYEVPTSSHAYRSDPKLLRKYLTYIDSRKMMLKDTSMLEDRTTRLIKNSYLKSLKDSYFIARSCKQKEEQQHLCRLVASAYTDGINIYRSNAPFTYFFMSRGPKSFDLWMLVYGKWHGLLRRLSLG